MQTEEKAGVLRSEAPVAAVLVGIAPEAEAAVGEQALTPRMDHPEEMAAPMAAEAAVGD